ncbi:MAG: N-acetylmuramoyl-L-alanine amidase family protein [Verrucomicrobiales bacterium]
MRPRPTPEARCTRLIAIIFMILAPLQARADDSAWEIVKYKGEDYVTTRSLQKFYQFQSYSSKGGNIFYRAPDLVMKARNGSQNLLINNTKFVLSNPVVSSGNNYLVSRMDLCKLIDPVLRPKFIKQASPFQTVVIDAGHGGIDTGSDGVYGNEKGHALRLANILKEELEKRRFRVKMTRTGDQNISRAQRVAFANRIDNAIFVSLHFNNGRRSASGIETYALSPQGAESTQHGPRSSDNAKFNGNQNDSANIALATAVHASVIHRIKPIDRGIKRARWDVLTGINKPAILFEGGFLTNPSEAKQIANYSHLKRLAGSIADGIVTYRNALRR